MEKEYRINSNLVYKRNENTLAICNGHDILFFSGNAKKMVFKVLIGQWEAVPDDFFRYLIDKKIIIKDNNNGYIA
ncbi:MAG: hypothetical protein IJR29_08230 [Butyrivibrio sp.]|nr:hypothetical protein [Butyrivibrio sp.]